MSIDGDAAQGDLALDVPLQGVQLIQASAGTGKTYTLAGLYTRLIVERRMSVRQVLVVTFTRAATEELKSRLRARLSLCADVAAGRYGDDATPSAELRQSRALIERALREEKPAALLSRLRLAALELDMAEISTIHGFCQRALREHAWDASALIDGELVPGDRDLYDTLAADLWRERAVANDAPGFAALAATVGSAQQLARWLPSLVEAGENLQPQPAIDEHVARAAMAARTAASQRLREGWRENGAQAFAALSAHAQAGHVNATSYPLKTIEADWRDFRADFDNDDVPPPEALERYATSTLNSSRCIKKNKSPLPAQPFFDAVAAVLPTFAQAEMAQRELGLRILRVSVDEARRRLDAIKRAARRFSYDDLIRRLRDALHGSRGEALARALHERYPCALVDEFQDTDAQQFDIFAAIYRNRGTLFLIGDPKQAIYRFRGGDIEAYFSARQLAQRAYSLQTNFRSTPAYLRALDRLYTFSGDAAFADARIAFEPVGPGGKAADDDLLIDGEPAPALTFWQLEEESASKADAVPRLAQGCAAGIAALLARARNRRALLRDILPDGSTGYRALEPRDLAVLVNRHDEAAAMQAALSALRIPNMSATRRSVFATDEARELHGLLDALVEFDEGRLRTALAGELFAATLADFARRDAEADGWRVSYARFVELREIWSTRGLLAMLERVFEQQAAEMLARVGGERRMTNWLQLADLAQAASLAIVGSRGLVDWLARRIALADDENEEEQLRLESDADRVQIRTLHASKGLEYPIVFMPFAALRSGDSPAYPKVLRYHACGQPTVYFVADKSAAQSPQAQAAMLAADREDLAERLRVLYVGLTRARQACFIAAGVFGKRGRIAALLHQLGVDSANGDTLLQRLNELAAGPDNLIRSAPLPEPGGEIVSGPPLPPLGPARRAAHAPRELRSSYSFSRLSADAHGEMRLDERAGRDDEPVATDTHAPLPLVEVPAALRGARFGTAFHEILEKTDFSAWRDWLSPLPPPSQAEVVERVLQHHALVGANRDEARLARQAVSQLVAATLNASLPFGARLCDLTPNQRRAEMPFHFAIDGADTLPWLQRMQARGYLPERSQFGVPRLSGLMTGVLDLVVHCAGRWWVIDYKTNVLQAGGIAASAMDYAPPRLAAAVRESEYDLQYLIYIVALHRWLSLRLGKRYDYARDIGGALYLFVRGLDASGSRGVHLDCPPGDLIADLDAMLKPAGVPA